MAIAGATAHVGSYFWPCLVAFGRQCNARVTDRPRILGGNAALISVDDERPRRAQDRDGRRSTAIGAAEVEVAAAIGAVAGTLALPMSMPGARTFPLTFPPTLRIGAAAVTATQRITAGRIRAGSTRTLAI